MKKILLICLSLVLVVLVGGLAYLAFNAKSLIAAQVPQIEKQLSEQLDAKVSIGDLAVSFFPSVKVGLQNVAVRPKTGDSKGIGFDEFLLKLNLFPLIAGRVEVDELLVDSPRLTIIKDQLGVYPEGLKPKPESKKKKKKQQAEVKDSEQEPKAEQEAAAPSSPVDIALNSIRVANANFVFDDKLSGKQYPISDFNLFLNTSLEGSELKVPELKLDMSVLDALPFAAIGEEISLNLETFAVKLSQLDLNLLAGTLRASGDINLKSLAGDLSLNAPAALDLSKLVALKDYAPVLEQLSLQGALSPSMQANIKSLQEYKSQGSIGLKGIGLVSGPVKLSALTGDIALNAENGDGSFSSEGLAYKLGKEELKTVFNATLKDKKFDLPELKTEGFGGSLIATGLVDLAANPLSFNKTVNISGMSLGRLASVVVADAQDMIDGTLKSTKLDIKGSLGADLLKTLTGSGSLELVDGTLKGFNLASETLSGISGVPFLDGSLLDETPEDFSAELSNPDTALRELTSSFKLGGGNMRLSSFKLLSTVFRLDAGGVIVLPATLDLKSTITFNSALSSALVTAVKELRSALDKRKRLSLPLAIEGTAPKIAVKPDSAKLVEMAAKAAVKETATQYLEKKLGVKGLGLSF